MPLMPTGMKYTSTVKATEWKTVCCEHCPAQYAYKVSREVTGTGSSPLFLDNTGAKERAAAEAHAQIERELADAVEPVWCPECGRYQPEMFSAVRLQRVILWYGLAVLVVIVGLITCAFWGHTSFFQNLLGVPGLTAIASAGIITVFAIVRSSSIDPNADAATRVGTRDTVVPVIMREEYEAQVDRALADGVPREELAQLRWLDDEAYVASTIR